MSATASATQELLTCPACAQPIKGMVSLDFVLGDVREKEVDAKVRVTGLRVTHDCIPKATR